MADKSPTDNDLLTLYICYTFRLGLRGKPEDFCFIINSIRAVSQLWFHCMINMLSYDSVVCHWCNKVNYYHYPYIIIGISGASVHD